MTLTQLSYAEHYAPLSAKELRSLADIQETDTLPCAPEFILAVERCGFAVDLRNGDIFNDDGTQIVKVGHVSEFEEIVRSYMDNIIAPRKDGNDDARTD